MSRKSIKVIEQLATASAPATYHVNHRLAAILLDNRTAEWAIVGSVLRKTPRYDRLTPDYGVIPGRPGAIRGLSCQIGPVLAEALRDPNDKWWAAIMLKQIRLEREAT